MYAGFISAIVFGKVLRVQSQAQVTFSDPLLARFDHYDASADSDTIIPCPVLELQIVNNCYNELGGEIIDAMVNCMAIKNDQKAVSTRNRIGINLNCSQDITDSQKTSIKEYHVSYSKVHVISPENPYFKRIWKVQHILDDESPLLLPKVRKLIRKNGGYWPHELNSSDALRECIKFDQLVVTLNGTFNISGASVFTQKVYDHFDMSVGYQFVNVMYKEEYSNKVMIDFDMINDVVEQLGGGGEVMVSSDF